MEADVQVAVGLCLEAQTSVSEAARRYCFVLNLNLAALQFRSWSHDSALHLVPSAYTFTNT